MRLLLDLQCVQSTSAVRGIGRYALSLARALVATAAPGDHVEVLLNGGDDPARLLRARTALETFLPARAVHVFDAPWPWQHDPSPQRREEAEAVRAAAVESLRPDVLLVGSVFEGDKETVLSVDGTGVPTAAVLYDLIPAADPGTYLLGPGADSYWRRFEDLRRADLLLAISAYSGAQARQLLGATCPPVVPVWGGPYPSGLFAAFEARAVEAPPVVPERYLLAVGGDHPRKNLDRLVEAWAGVADRAGTSLVVACRLNVGTVRRLRRIASRAGLADGELVLTGEVSEDGLEALYRGALAFVFPSTEEGLGLPPLEAMAAGCPTVLSSGSSLSELVDLPEAYFDGASVPSIRDAMTRVLHDHVLRDRLRATAAASTARFTWTRTAELSWDALRGLLGRHPYPADRDVEMGQVDALVERPLPVSVPVAPRSTDPAVLAAEDSLSVRSPLPPGARTALAPTPALVVLDDGLARDLVAAGLLEQAVLPSLAGVVEAGRHDPYAALRARLARPAFPDDLVRSLAHPPRWTLERPWPVWLLLTEADLDVEALRSAVPDVVLVVAGPAAALLARSADTVLVDAALLPALEGDLHRARCLGAQVVTLGADPVETLRATPAVRTTGWPWGG